MCTFTLTILGPKGLVSNGYDVDFSPGGKAAWAQSYTSTPRNVFIAWYLIKQRMLLHNVALS